MTFSKKRTIKKPLDGRFRKDMHSQLLNKYFTCGNIRILFKYWIYRADFNISKHKIHFLYLSQS